MTKDGW
jgi:hypothetical protein